MGVVVVTHVAIAILEAVCMPEIAPGSPDIPKPPLAEGRVAGVGYDWHTLALTVGTTKAPWLISSVLGQ